MSLVFPMTEALGVPTVKTICPRIFTAAKVQRGTSTAVSTIQAIFPARERGFFAGRCFFVSGLGLRMTSGSCFRFLAAYFGLYPIFRLL